MVIAVLAVAAAATVGGELAQAATSGGTLLGTVVFSHIGSPKCASSATSGYVIPNTGTSVPASRRNADNGVAIAPDADGATMVYTDCWRDNTLTMFAPPSLNGGTVTVPDSQQLTVAIVDQHGNPIPNGFGALAYDPARHRLWACEIDPTNPEMLSAQVGWLTLPSPNLDPVTFTPAWRTPTDGACDNHLAYDPTNDSLWTGADIAKGFIYDETGIDTTSPTATHVALPSSVPANSGVAATANSLLLSDPQGTTQKNPKKLFEVPRSSATNLDGTPTVVMTNPTMRIDALACDDQTYAQPAVWVNFGKFDEFQVWTIPSRSPCSPPPTATLSVSQTALPSPITADSQPPSGGLTYTVTVRNTGGAGQDDVTVTDTPPSDAIFDSATPSQGTACGGTPVTCNLGTLQSGDSATVTIVVTPIVPQSSETNGASVISDTSTVPVSSSRSAAVIAAANTDYASVTDAGFSPTSSTIALGDTMQWNLLGPASHGVQDTTGVLADPPLAADAYEIFAFPSGAFTVSDTEPGFNGRMTVRVPLVVPTGHVAGPFTVTWAPGGLPPGTTESVQVMHPGQKWKAWLTSSDGAARYTPKKTGTFRFRALLNGPSGSSAYSPTATVSVTS